MEYKPVTELTYNQATAELDSIMRTMQSDECDIDRLASLTRRATELITECRKRLTLTDQELQSILSQVGQKV